MIVRVIPINCYIKVKNDKNLIAILRQLKKAGIDLDRRYIHERYHMFSSPVRPMSIYINAYGQAKIGYFDTKLIEYNDYSPIILYGHLK